MNHGTESFFDDISQKAFHELFNRGMRSADKGLIAVVKYGLPLLTDALNVDVPRFGESASVTATAPPAFSADALAHRALVAEAALQAVTKLPPYQLEEEGFFDDICDVIKTIAPVAVQVCQSPP